MVRRLLIIYFFVQAYSIALHAQTPDTLRVQLDRANRLSWNDKVKDAQRGYLQILQATPQNAEARKNLGRVTSWLGRHREAQKILKDYLKDFPNDTEARFWYAQSLSWMGRSDRAVAEAYHILTVDSNYNEATKLIAEINKNTRSQTVVDYSRSTQSDNLDIHNYQVDQNFNWNYNRTSLGLRFQKTDYVLEDKVDKVNAYRPFLLGRHRFSDATEWNVWLSEQFLNSNNEQFRFFLYDTWFTIWPNDLLRFDISSSRKIFDNYRSLVLGVTAYTAGLSADITPTDKLKLSLRSSRWWYSDDNKMTWLQSELGYRIINKPQTTLSGRYTNFNFEKQLNNGYFNPLNFHAADVRLQSWSFFGKWLLEADGSFGREWEPLANSVKPMGNITLKVGRVLGNRVYMEARLQRFDSRISNEFGFSRTTGGLKLEYKW